MKRKYQNAFFIFGLVVLAIMITQLDFAQVRAGLSRAGYWFFAVLLLWVPLYAINATSWHLIIRSGQTADDGALNRQKPSFALLYRLTVSGFALNYATPGGLMGGEPYRIMSLAPLIGTERASSSVILYVMTHIFSHFCFWLLAVAIYVLTRPLTTGMSIVLAAATLFCLTGIWFFMAGYRKGVAVRLTGLLRFVPFIRKRAARFIDSHRERLDTIDRQIADLNRSNRRTFAAAVGLELFCRLLSAAEIMFILLVLMPVTNGTDDPAVALCSLYIDCVLILAFTSLIANLLFFMPLQLGGREGGFLMSTAGLAMTAGTGIFIALIVRVRELVWTAVGLLLIKLH